MKKETASRGGRVDLIGKGFEMHTALFQVSHTTPQSVEFPHNQGVVFP